MTSARPLKVGLVQMSMGEDPADNLGRAVTAVREAATKTAPPKGLAMKPTLLRGNR